MASKFANVSISGEKNPETAMNTSLKKGGITNALVVQYFTGQYFTENTNIISFGLKSDSEELDSEYEDLLFYDAQE